MTSVKVVTDSTADVPPHLLQELDIEVVPLYINFGDETYRDGIDITAETFSKMLSESDVHPTTLSLIHI